MPAPYPQEFPEGVVALARGRGAQTTVKQVAEDFGISEATLSNWLKAAAVEARREPGVTSAEAEGLRRLRRRNKLLEQENEVLHRAAAYLSQAILKLGGSPT